MNSRVSCDHIAKVHGLEIAASPTPDKSVIYLLTRLIQVILKQGGMTFPSPTLHGAVNGLCRLDACKKPKVHRMSLVVLPYRSHPQIRNLGDRDLQGSDGASQLTYALRLSTVVICIPCRSPSHCSGLTSNLSTRALVQL